jgi:hypothetical protein
MSLTIHAMSFVAQTVLNGTLEWYVAVHSSWHIKGALTGDDALDKTFLMRIVESDDDTLSVSCALALGDHEMQRWADMLEHAGFLESASHFLIASARLGCIS